MLIVRYNDDMKFDISKLIDEFHLDPDEFILIHVGASICQEAEYYSKFNFKKIIWVEALPEVFEQGRTRIMGYKNQVIINSLLFSKEGVAFKIFRSSNNGESSSILKPDRHLDIHQMVEFEEDQRVIFSSTLDEILIAEDDLSKVLLVLDVQGAEISVIDGGMTIALPRTEFIFTEVSTIQLYQNQALFHILTRKLKQLGFSLEMHDINIHSPYGDALFVRNWNSKNKEVSWSSTAIFGLLSRTYHHKIITLIRRVIQKAQIARDK
jgi:FkbM family methyltransferase